MIIHIGDKMSLYEKDILVILDKKSIESSINNIKFIDNLLNNDKSINKIDDSIKSYIIISAESNKKNVRSKESLKLYLSNISSKSLINRQKDIDRRGTNE